MEGLLDTYLFETSALIEQLDELLLKAEEVGDFTADDVNEIFRSMHTIKGSSAMMEFQPLMEIAHHIEDLFFEIRENGTDTLSQTQKSDLFNLLFKSTDRLREDVEKVQNGQELSMDIEGFIHEIDAFLAGIKDPGAAANSTPAVATSASDAAAPTESDLPLKDLYVIHIFFDENCGMEHLRAFIVLNSLRESDFDPTCFPPDVETNSDTAEYIINNGFYLGFENEEVVQSAMNILPTLSNIHSYEVLVNPVDTPSLGDPQPAVAPAVAVDAPAQTSAPEEVQAAAPTPAPTPQAQDRNNQLKTLNQTKQSLISVNLSKLDNLMAIVGEIVIAESMVTSSPELQNLKLDNFLKSARQLRKLTDDLQDIAMSLRMVPVSGVFQKMNRIVRDMTKTLNKDVRLTIIGEDTEVDKTINDSIADPIMHLVRNAMDHAIEKDPSMRTAAGKPSQAEIILSAQHTGSEVVITVQDDGKGIDPEVILAKAAKRGLLVKPEEEYSKREILSLLLLPGFSTNSQVTEYSGRGVGLDVVKKNVESIGGTISISSELGQGCCFTMKIPLTLAIVDGMEISIADQIFTIPIPNILQSFKATNDDIIYDAHGYEMVRCMGDFYPIVRLHELFEVPGGYTDIEEGVLIWVEAGDKSFCLFVDNILGEQQVVVKPMPSYLNSFNIKSFGISGCTILGDGNISIILDVANILTASQQLH